MAFKKNKKSDDDFDFDMGGDLFDLGDPFGGSQETKPPKGIKGYMKNVAKSIKNIGIKLGKTYLPEVDSLIQDLRESDDESNNKTKFTIKSAKDTVKKYSSSAAEVVKDLGKDIKNRARTGYFFKSDADSFGGGDLGLGDLSDSGFDDYSPAPDSSDNGDPELIRASKSESSANKRTKMQILSNMKMSNDISSATIGATQAHIKAESSMFSQNLLIESEHHRQKMTVMRNIATNIGKIIKQNNVSLKAQMEYSLKSLAFAQDTAAMIKEIRDMQWKFYTPKPKEKLGKSKKQSIFGMGFNKNEWLKHVKKNITRNVGGGSLDMIKGMVDMMSGMGDLGMSPSSMLMSMVGDTIFDNITNAIIPDSIKKDLGRINKSAGGLPNVMNNMFGKIAENGISNNGIISKIIDKIPFIDDGMKSDIKSKIGDFAGKMHVSDRSVVNTGKYDFKPSEGANPHPFDNLAHHTLTTIIPKYLARIDAGISGKEEVFIDEKGQPVNSNKIAKEINRKRQDTFDYSPNMSRAKDSTKSRLIDDSIIKSLNLSDSQINKLNDNMMKNLYGTGFNLTEDTRKQFSNKDSRLYSLLANNITNATGIEDLSPEQKDSLIQSFMSGINDFSYSDDFVEFTQGMNDYKDRLNKTNTEIEDKYGSIGASGYYNAYTLSESNDISIKNLKHKADAERKKIEEIKKNDPNYTRNKKYKEALNNYSSYVKDINALKQDNYSVDESIVNNEYSGIDIINNSLEDVSKNYDIKALSRTDTNSVVNSIYNLLLDGLIVYPKDGMPKDVSDRYSLRASVLKLNKDKYLNEIEAKQNEDKENEKNFREYNEFKRNSEKYSYSNDDEEPELLKKYGNTPFIGKLLRAGYGLTSKTKSLFTWGADNLEHYAYGRSFENNGKTQDINKKIGDFVNQTGATLGAEKNKLAEVLKNEGLVHAIGTGASDIWNSKAGLATRSISKGLANATKEAAVDFYNTAKSQATDVYNTGKTGGIKAAGSKFVQLTKQNIGSVIDSIKKSPTYSLISNYFTEETGKLEEVIQDKAKTNKFVEKLYENGVIAKDKFLTIKKVTEENGAVEGFKLLEKTVADSKAFKTSSGLLKSAGSFIAGSVLGKKVMGFFNRGGEADNAEGRKQGDLKDQILDKKEKEEEEDRKRKTAALEKISENLQNISKGGVKLDKETVDKIDESNEKAADKMSASTQSAVEGANGGILGQVSNFLDKTGLSKTKTGASVQSALRTARTAKNITGVLTGGMSTAILTSVGGSAAGVLRSAAGGVSKLGSKAALGVAKLSGKGALGIAKLGGKAALGGAKMAVKGTAGAIGQGHKTFFTLLGKVLEGVIKKFPGGKAIIKAVIEPLKKNILKLGTKIAAKIGLSTAAMGSIVAAVASFAAGFTTGSLNAKKSLGLGKDIKVTAGMRLICGLANGFNALLFGIPDMIAKILLRKKNFAQWMYEKFGSKEEKAAINRYKKYCSMKAVIYGISNPEALVEYENRNVADRAGRAALNALTLGLVKNNSDRDASLLGFKSVKIFKYWKTNKYEPLEQLRDQVAEVYGGKKVVDKMETFTADKDDDGEISEDEQEEAEKQQAAIEHQQNFRTDFLKQAREWVINNKLAWLNSDCTLENFFKRTGQKAKGIMSTKDRIKRTGKYVAAGLLFGPLGIVAVAAMDTAKKKKKANAAKKGDARDINAAGIAKNNKKKDSKDNKVVGKKKRVKGERRKKIFAAIGNGYNSINNSLNSLNEFIKKFIANKAINTVKGIKVVLTIMKDVIKSLGTAASKDSAFAKKLISQLVIFTVIPATVAKAVGAFIAGRFNPGRYIGFDIDQKTDKIKLIGGLIAMMKAVLPCADEACAMVMGKTLKRIIFDAVMNFNKNTAIDSFNFQKAKIMGIDVDCMLKYEEKLNQNNFAKKAINFIKNFFGSGADRTDARLCGFKSIEVFKFWREEKFDPLRNLEESVSRKFGDIDDLRSETPKDPEIQKKFRQAYLQQARQYVKDRGLEWLTSRTTENELNERKKNKTLYLKSDSQYKRDAAAAENSKNPFKRFINFFISGNADNRGNAKQSYQNNNTKYYNYSDVDLADTKAMEDTLKDEYKYNAKAMTVMKQASASIKSFWKSISPNFYGDQEAAKVSADPKLSNDTVYSGNGGPDTYNSQGLVTKIRDRVIDSRGSAVYDLPRMDSKGIKDPVNKIRNINKQLKSGMDDGYGLNEAVVSRSRVMNSIVNDFAKNFGKELNKRLDILEMMHKESMRHNKVSEEFFIAALRLMQQIASKSDNNQISSTLDSAISALIH